MYKHDYFIILSFHIQGSNFCWHVDSNDKLAFLFMAALMGRCKGSIFM